MLRPGFTRHGKLLLCERPDLPDDLQAISDDAFYWFEVLPFEYYDGAPHEACEIPENTLRGLTKEQAEAIVDVLIQSGYRVFALMPPGSESLQAKWGYVSKASDLISSLG